MKYSSANAYSSSARAIWVKVSISVPIYLLKSKIIYLKIRALGSYALKTLWPNPHNFTSFFLHLSINWGTFSIVPIDLNMLTHSSDAPPCYLPQSDPIPAEIAA